MVQPVDGKAATVPAQHFQMADDAIGQPAAKG